VVGFTEPEPSVHPQDLVPHSGRRRWRTESNWIPACSSWRPACIWPRVAASSLGSRLVDRSETRPEGAGDEQHRPKSAVDRQPVERLLGFVRPGERNGFACGPDARRLESLARTARSRRFGLGVPHGVPSYGPRIPIETGVSITMSQERVSQPAGLEIGGLVVCSRGYGEGVWRVARSGCGRRL
jgi:hypothetical protein